MRVRILKVKDNQLKKKDAFSEIANLTSKIADKTLEQLEREGIFVFPELVKDADDITRDQMILQGLNDCFRTGNVMGFLGYGAERLVIESRFGGDDEDYFLQYLLDRVLDFPNIVDLATDANQDNRLFNFLLFLFPYYLKTAMRKGVFKQYIRRRYNDGNVRGAIDIARHIERNTPFTGSVAYSQREFSYDNYLTELVRHTIEFIKRKPYGNNLLIKVKDEVKLIVDATPSYERYDCQKIIEANKKKAVRHAYFREYLALQRLCLLILQHQKHQIGAGSKQIYGILFDGAWLWEEYIGSLVDNVFYHPMNKAGTVVFINGCFWHGHEGCRYFKWPKSNQEFWKDKINANRERDKRNLDELAAAGWHVITVWECDLKERRDETLDALVHEIRQQPHRIYKKKRSPDTE